MHAQETITLTEADAGCWLDGGLRGHSIARDVIWLAQGYGFVVDRLANFAVDSYEDHSHEDGYPLDELIELSHEAVDWLNSGQETCAVCHGTGVDYGPHHVCSTCSGTGRAPRIHGQNFLERVRGQGVLRSAALPRDQPAARVRRGALGHRQAGRRRGGIKPKRGRNPASPGLGNPGPMRHPTDR